MSTVIVTGAVQGIGLGIARKFAEEGYNVVVSDLKQKSCDTVAKSLNEEFHVETKGIAADVSKQKDMKKLVEKTIKEFGELDTFVNNAGIYPFKPFMEMSEKDWEKVMDINLKGSFFAVQESAKVMEKGSVIIISSIASIQAFSGLVHYCASKAGVNGMVRAAAVELAPNITVNAVLPGAIDTPGAAGVMDEDAKKQTADNVPMKRWGLPADIAGACIYLAQAEYVTGQTLVVDGGWSVR